MTDWQSSFKNKPEPDKPIIILTDSRHVMKGYMRKFFFKGEDKPTYSFHGQYYDFQKHETIYCLVNAIAWIPMPDAPTVEAFNKEHE